MARIAIDCDGVLANFVDAFADLINRTYPGRVPRGYQPSDWEWSDVLMPQEMGLLQRKIARSPNWWLGLNAYSRNVGELAMWLTSRVDHDVWICTARSPSAGLTIAKQTQLWIESCGLRGVNNFLGIIDVASGDDKSQLYEAAAIEWSIDDKPETVIGCGLIDTFEHHAYLLNQPWNASAGVHNRVSTVAQFLSKIG